ncbi:hypothetical protein F511_08975 [Dorcoceras hygrometricum]|uniref:SANT domain-containing protein n=1 Tax=Dorcoceras hygrometricum TaxID=472368 RepID=A0A2Z7AQ61_9LAMI|nr:hypothetical protein F511_08975 [Dorcoceras hygrometricum]
MASVHENQSRDCSDKMLDEQLHPSNFDNFGETETLPRISSNSADSCDEFGEPDILPRIGDQYQAQIPDLIEASNYIFHNPSVGSPLPLPSTDQVKHSVKTETYSEHKDAIESDTDSNCDILKIGIKSLCHPRNPVGKSDDQSSTEKLRRSSGQGDLMFPGLSSEYWSDAEKAGFLLGIYVFEKNFVEVRRFIDTKEMGAILSFYYGEFYGTDVYRKWSEGRKTKSKKCAYGRKIFSGLRQQELLSRILSGLTEECRSALLEVSKRFGDEKMSLAKYVASLKAMIGMSALVGAVGIGTGKQDLTRMAMEPSRSNQAVQMRPEIPTGKACSSLTTEEIIKFLSGDYRLSKARSNDLFWEAIWPRLLARGWHSEQPKDQVYAVGSKHCLVFLVPGVQKFSRRKLVKGDHYFDSVTDVLSKVAKEPELIELHTEEDGTTKSQEDHRCTSGRGVEEDDSDQSSRQRHFYLQPRTPLRHSGATKFTVVDTSLPDGKLREIRSLSTEISNILTYGKRTTVMDEDSSYESAYESETMSSVLLNSSVIDRVSDRPNKSGAEMLPRKKENVGGTMHQDSHDASSDISLISLKKKKNLSGNKESRNVVEPLLSRKPKKGNKPYSAPTAKQRKKTISGSHEETRDHKACTLTSTRLDNEISSCCSGIHGSAEKFSTEMVPCENKLASTGSPNCSAAENVECNPNTSTHSTEFSQVNPHKSQTLIDLNMPQVFQSENGIFSTESSKEQNTSILKSDDQPLPKVSPIQATSEQQSTTNSLRHGTRNRPPTTKALEARANGYLTVNRRRKSKDTSWQEDPSSRPLQRNRVVSRDESSACVSVPSEIGKSQNGVVDSGNSNMFGELQAMPVANDKSFADKLAHISSPGN